MENDNNDIEEFDLHHAQRSLTAEYGMNEAEVSKIHLILYQKLASIDDRLKKLEEHLLVSVIHKDM